MSRRRSAVSVAPLLFVLAACAGEERTPAKEQTYASEEVRAEYEAFSQRWFATFNERNVAGLVSLYDPDAIRMPSGQPGLRGPEAIRADFQRIFATYDSVRIEGISQDVHFSEEWAADRGVYTFSYREAGSQEPPSRERGKYVILARKPSGGAWRILWEIWNPSTPEPEPSEGSESDESESEESASDRPEGAGRP